MSLPRHIVIVPDGNRRWAKKKGKPSFFGHRAGMKAVEKITQAAFKLEIPYLTIWGCSVANITERSSTEVKFLFNIFEIMFKRLARRKELKQKKIKVRVLGRWQEFFPESLKKAVRNVVNATEKYDGLNFTLLMAYDGRDEMLAAVRKISASGKKPSLIDYDAIKGSLWSVDLPPVDLVIRTGGEPHWSAGMMMWDVAEAQLYFTETLWPDFSPKEFQKALNYYARTERRHGK